MPMDEIVRGIEKTDIENMQDVIQVAIARYQELYSDWRIMFVPADANAQGQRSLELLELIRRADEILERTSEDELNEK